MLKIGVDSSDAKKASKDVAGMADAGTKASARMKQSMSDVTDTMRRTATDVNDSSRRIERQSRQAVNNLSYQLTDIGQMMAVGQSPFIMMMQQGEQTAGAMRDLSRSGGVIHGLKAAIGTIVNPVSLATFAVIGLGGAAVQWFTAAGEEAEKLEDTVKDLGNTFSEYNGFLEASLAPLDELTEKYGQATAAGRALQEQLAENARLALEQKTNKVFEDAAGSLTDSSVLKGLQTTQMADTFELERPFMVFSESAREAREEVDALVQAVMDAQLEMLKADGIDAQVEAAQNMLTAYSAAADASGSRNEEETQFITLIGTTLESLIQFQQLEEKRLGTSTKIREGYEQYYNSRVQGEEYLKNAEDAKLTAMAKQYGWMAATRIEGQKIGEEAAALLLTYQQELAVKEATLRHGEGSYEMLAAQWEIEKQALSTKLQALGVSEETASSIVEAARAAAMTSTSAVDLTNNLGTAVGQAYALRAALLAADAAISSMGVDISRRIAVVKAKNLALQEGTNAATAGEIALLKQKAKEETAALVKGGASIDLAVQKTQVVRDQIDELSGLLTTGDKIEEGIRASKAAGTKASSAASKAAKAAAKEARELADEIQNLEFDADPLKKYNHELENLQKLAANGLSDGAYKHAVEELNSELLDSVPIVNDAAEAFADWAMSMFQDFESAKDLILNSLKNMIREMLITVARNRIFIPITAGLTGGGVAGAAGQLTGGSSGGGLLGTLTGGGGGAAGGGILGSLGAGFSALTSGIGAGLSMSLGGLMSGGIGGMTSVIGTQLGAATASVGAFGAALGAVALPLAAVGAVFSFFKKKTKELDAGLRITVNGMDSLIESFQVIQTKRFWGLSKKVKTHYSALADEAASPIVSTIEDIANSVMTMGETFGFAAANIDRAKLTVKISTKGLSDEEIEEAITEEMTRIGDVFADAIVGNFEEVVQSNQYAVQTGLEKLFGIPADLLYSAGQKVSHVNEEFEALKKEGEGSYDALSRLVNSITLVNTVLDTFGNELLEVSLQGASMASDLADLAGGLEAFNTATSLYYQTVYSEQERVAKTAEQLAEVMGELGYAMPETRAQYRAMVDAQDLTTVAGREMFTALVALAAQMDTVLPAFDSLTEKLGALVAQAVSDVFDPLTDQIAASNQAATEASQSATEFFRLAESLRSAADGIGGVRDASDLASAGAKYASQLSAALSGDVDALSSLGASGQSLATDSADFASTSVDLLRIEGTIANQLRQSAAVAESLGLGADYQAMLFEVQTAALEELRDMLETGNATEELLNEQVTVLNSLKDQIVASTQLQIAKAIDNTGTTVAALLDGNGQVIGALSSEGALAIAALREQTAATTTSYLTSSYGMATQIVEALDANNDGLLSSQEAQAALLLSGYVEALAGVSASVDSNGRTTVQQIRDSLQGKASDAAINAVVGAVDRNKDGVVSAEELMASRLLSNMDQTTLQQIAALREQTAATTTAYLSASLNLATQVLDALDANMDGVVSAQEAQAASIVSAYESTVFALETAINNNGQMTAQQIRESLAGKASNAAIEAVINAVDRNKDGVITAEEVAAARMLTTISQGTLQQITALANQNAVFGNAITGQTGSITNTQSLTNDQLSDVKNLQGETVSITELVERAVAGNETLTSALLTRMNVGINVSGVSGMVAGLDQLSSLVGRIVAAQEAQLAAAEAEANRQSALREAQAALESSVGTQSQLIEQVNQASGSIIGLAQKYGVYLNAKSGPVQMSQTASFGVNDQGLFEGKYNQISYSGSSSKARDFKNEFYGDGGLYSQTYGQAGELRALAETIEARRQEIIDLGGVPAFMDGGSHMGGYRIVGENGPELEKTGPSQISNAKKTQDILSAGTDTSNLEQGLSEIRRALLAVIKHTKRVSDRVDAWDNVGLPDTRV